jgi:hypothetical protein
MPSKDREDAIRQGRNDLDTHENNPAPHTDEEQARGQRHRTKQSGAQRRKGDFGVGE